MNFDIEKFRSLAYTPLVSSGASMSSLAERRPTRDWMIVLAMSAFILIGGAVFGVVQFLSMQRAASSEITDIQISRSSLSVAEVEEALAARRSAHASFESLRAASTDIIDPSQ